MVTDKTIVSGNTMAETTEPAKKISLSGDPNRAMQQMMDKIDALRNIYIRENSALNASDTPGFMNIQTEKIEAVRNYHDGAQQLLARKEEIRHIDNALKQQLKEKQEEFSGIMAENLKAIDRLRNGVKRLNDRIMTSARDAAQVKNVNYSDSGQLNKNERAVSIGLSETA